MTPTPPTDPILAQLNIVARDFDASVAFYRRLGLPVTERSAPDFGHRHAEVTLPNGLLLELDDEALAALYHAGWRGADARSRVVLGFSVPTRADVDRIYADLTASGYRGRQQPYDAFWGARYAVVADADGNDVGLMSPIDPERRQWPPSASPGG
jgi:catechol 2,3-dioxygenase-like lactoylglutathione lyase family enzyme